LRLSARRRVQKVGYQLVDAPRSFPGAVYPINAKGGEVAGRKAFASLRELATSPDLAILGIPATACPAALREAADLGVGGAVIVSGGFGESGEGGAALQHELERICTTSDLRLLGPNTSGYTRPGTGCHACFLPAVQEFKQGPLSIVAQSGGVNLTLSFLARRQGLGLRLAVGLVTRSTSMRLTSLNISARPRHEIIGVHLEGVRSATPLYDAVARARRKPVVVLPVGRAQVADFAESHTGNRMGATLTVAALRQAGGGRRFDRNADRCSHRVHCRRIPPAIPALAF
jgi:acetyltransferase